MFVELKKQIFAMPALTEETRQDYRNETENSRISIQNIRKNINNSAKELQKDSEMNEDV